MVYPNAVAITAQGLFTLILAILTIMLSSCDGGGGTKKATSIPLEPTNLVAKGVNKGIDLSWKEAKGAESYTVYYHTASFDSTADGGILKQAGITKTKTIITGLTNDTEYYLRVAAINADGEAKLSTQIVSAIANLQPPTNLKATGVYKGVDLSWGAVKGAASYTVYYHTASFDKTTVSGVKRKTVTASTTSTSITGLTDGIKYYLRVEVINAEKDTKLSDEVTATATTKLLAPKPSAAASIISPAAVDLSWDAVAGVTDYKIYYANQSIAALGGNPNLAGAGGGVKITTDTSITIGDLSADTTYYFVVAANYDGQEKSAPEVTADSSYIAELAMGGYHGCVRLNTGSIKCWGSNSDGELGVGDIDDKKTATSVSGIRAKQLSAGDRHSCAIDLSDRLYCWGFNGSFRLGLSDKSHDRIIPTLVTQANLAKVSLVAAGRSSTCALAGGNNYCLGSQEFGGLGNDVSSDDPTMDAQEINDITPDVKQFALSEFSGCAIDASDALWCWGKNNHGQVGDGTTTNRASPVNPSLQGSSKATMLDGIDFHYCVVDNAKKVQCWGFNHYGQLGIDSTTDSNIPQYVLASDSTSDHLTGVSKIAAGAEHSCALLITGGKVRCWGSTYRAVIGPNDGNDRLIANTDMQGISDAIDIAAGFYHTCVLLKDKARVKCWGYNGSGQLGSDKTSDGSHTPVAGL